MLDPATARLCVWRLPLEAAFRLFSKLGSLGGSIRERFSRTGRTRPALARPAFSRWLLENDRLRERWPCQWLNVLYFPFSETSPTWLEEVTKHCLNVNEAFLEPLPYSEIKATAKSIATYCWKKDAYCYQEFIDRQSRKGQMGGTVSKRTKVSNSERTLKPWLDMGISQSTYYRRKKLGKI